MRGEDHKVYIVFCRGYRQLLGDPIPRGILLVSFKPTYSMNACGSGRGDGTK